MSTSGEQPTTPDDASEARNPAQFLRGLADLLEMNETRTVGNATPGLLLQRLYGSLNDDRDETVVNLLGLGFSSGDATEACESMGLLDGE